MTVNTCRRTRRSPAISDSTPSTWTQSRLSNRPGIRFADQARIQPRRYLAGVARAFVESGGRIYEHSAADEFCRTRAR